MGTAETVIDGFYVTTNSANRGIVAGVGGWNLEPDNITISHNKVFRNRPPGVITDYTYDGGISLTVEAGARGTISDNHSFENTTGRGAGIEAGGTEDSGLWGEIKILRNRVENNISEASHGGAGEFHDGVPDARVEYELVAGNECDEDGRTSEFMFDDDITCISYGRLKNVTVINHVCPSMTEGAIVLQAQSKVEIDNSIFWNNIGSGNQKQDFGVDTGTMAKFVSITNTTSGEVVSGAGNSNQDLLFVNPAAGNYHSSRFPERGAFAPGGLNPEP